MQSRDVEVHLSVGEALVCCVLGPCSPVSRDPWMVLESEFKPPEMSTSDDKDLKWLYDKLLGDMVKQPHPNQKQVNYDHPILQNYLVLWNVRNWIVFVSFGGDGRSVC